MANNGVKHGISTVTQSTTAEVAVLDKELARINARLAEIDQEREQLHTQATRIEDALTLIKTLSLELEMRELDAEEVSWNDLAELGIQEACYRVLEQSAKPLEAWEIRDWLRRRGVAKIDEYANALAVIHTSLKRIPDRVKTTKRRVKVNDDQTAMVRFYEAVKRVPEKAPKK